MIHTEGNVLYSFNTLFNSFKILSITVCTAGHLKKMKDKNCILSNRPSKECDIIMTYVQDNCRKVKKKKNGLFQSFSLKAAVLKYNVNNNDKSPQSSALILITPIHQQRVVLVGTCQASRTLKRLLLLEEESHVNSELRRWPDQARWAFHSDYHTRRLTS